MFHFRGLHADPSTQVSLLTTASPSFSSPSGLWLVVGSRSRLGHHYDGLKEETESVCRGKLDLKPDIANVGLLIRSLRAPLV